MSTSSRFDSAHQRNVILALQTAAMPHDARCRLGTSLGQWLDHKNKPHELAAMLRVAVPHLEQARKLARRAERLARRLETQAADRGARMLTLLDTDYPAALLDLELPPPTLTLIGELPREPRAAIVGPRHADPYGLEAARHFAFSLAERGVPIVSGFARGVDATAHRAALDAGAPTVAVLGCGIDVAYPRHGGSLRRDIEAAGTLMTEFPFSMPPQAHHFPIRNRLIAALACAVLVVQATHRSGSLITARMALDLGRDVFALPGRIYDRRSQGTNELIRDGALVALEPRDLLESLGRARSFLSRAAATSTVEPVPDPLLERLAIGEGDLDSLANALGLALPELQHRLLQLELEGSAQRTAAGTYRLSG